LYEVQWVPDPDTSSPQGELSRWLVLADRTGVGEHLARLLTARGDSIELLYEPESMSALREAVRTWAAQGRGEIIHLWSLDAGLSDLERAQKITCKPLLNVLQTLVGADIQTCGTRAVTAGAEPVLLSDPINPAQALTWGIGRTAVLEHPEIWRGL